MLAVTNELSNSSRALSDTAGLLYMYDVHIKKNMRKVIVVTWEDHGKDDDDEDDDDDSKEVCISLFRMAGNGWIRLDDGDVPNVTTNNEGDASSLVVVNCTINRVIKSASLDERKYGNYTDPSYVHTYIDSTPHRITPTWTTKTTMSTLKFSVAFVIRRRSKMPEKNNLAVILCSFNNRINGSRELGYGSKSPEGARNPILFNITSRDSRDLENKNTKKLH
ncbi:uncharacterized protein V1478_002614 [Vespula squamosa]|uniref:Uncharacterized protein n=1 Tax=Vespula squamosa TaxID=30214 RepID=A0ABD2BTC8_VESSQ